MIIFAPIKNFTCDVSVIDLGNSLSIAKLNKEEIDELWKNFNQISFLQLKAVKKEEIREMETYFHLKREVGEKIIEGTSSETWDLFDNVISALRIFKKELVWFNAIYTITPLSKSERFPKPYFESAPYYDITKSLPAGYKLDKEEIVLFKQFWDKFSKIPPNSPITTATIRFSEKIERYRKVDDHLIDCFISFEFLFSDGGSESTHKIARRTAVFLEKNKDKRIRIYREMKRAYNERSNIVHGRKIDYKKIAKYYTKVEDYLRNCLRKIIEEEQYSKDTFLNKLDFN